MDVYLLFFCQSNWNLTIEYIFWIKCEIISRYMSPSIVCSASALLGSFVVA